MADFQIKGQIKGNKYDGAYCTVDTFRHLLTEKKAEQHLINVAKVLKKNGIYILGLHLLSKQEVTNKVIRWTTKRGRLTVKTSMTMLELDKKKRRETLKVILRPETSNHKKCYTALYQLRTYTLKQLIKLLDKTSVFEIVNAYDESYDISSPTTLNSRSEYAVLLLRRI